MLVDDWLYIKSHFNTTQKLESSEEIANDSQRGDDHAEDDHPVNWPASRGEESHNSWTLNATSGKMKHVVFETGRPGAIDELSFANGAPQSIIAVF
jgi:hypothetical protein